MGRLAIPATKVALACLPMAAWGLLSPRRWDVLAVPGTAAKVAVLCGELGVGVGLYAVTVVLLRSEELRWALALLKPRGSGAMKSGASL
jgi:hypothetical protein